MSDFNKGAEASEVSVELQEVLQAEVDNTEGSCSLYLKFTLPFVLSGFGVVVNNL